MFPVTAIPIKQESVPVILPLAHSRELFNFSPFGLGCRRCKKSVTIQLDERSIQIHLKKHGMDSRIATIRSLVDKFKTDLEIAIVAATIEPY